MLYREINFEDIIKEQNRKTLLKLMQNKINSSLISSSLRFPCFHRPAPLKGSVIPCQRVSTQALSSSSNAHTLFKPLFFLQITLSLWVKKYGEFIINLCQVDESMKSWNKLNGQEWLRWIRMIFINYINNLF